MRRKAQKDSMEWGRSRMAGCPESLDMYHYELARDPSVRYSIADVKARA